VYQLNTCLAYLFSISMFPDHCAFVSAGLAMVDAGDGSGAWRGGR
jgi:hypothetical protein